MSDRSPIEWTDATWNPVRGCTKISPGCAHCYAEALAERFRGVPGHPYEQGFDLRLVPEKLAEPLRWKTPRTIFVNSMSDLFHEDVPDNYVQAAEALARQFRLHLHRGIGYLAAPRTITAITDLIQLAVDDQAQA
jgi:protein gp37